MRNTINAILVIGFILLALGFAGASDYDEAVRQEAEYCDAVHSGKWPDYRGDYRQSCLNGIPRQ